MRYGAVLGSEKREAGAVMSQMTRFGLAMGLSIVGTLCFIAGQDRFAFLSPETAKFAGMAAFLVSGLCWAYFGVGAAKRR